MMIHSCPSVRRLNNKRNNYNFGKADGNSFLQLIAMHIIRRKRENNQDN